MRPVSPFPVVLALWAGGLCAAAQFAKIGLLLPELDALYPGAGPALGFLVSSVSVVGVLFGLVAGLLAGTFGPRRLLLAGLALGAVLSLLQSLLPPLPLLLASRVLEGVSHLAIVVAAPTLIASVSTPRLRPAAMTLWGTFFGVSFALTAWLGLPLVAAHGPGALFLLHGVCTGAAAALLAVLLPRDPSRPSRLSQPSPRAPGSGMTSAANPTRAVRQDTRAADVDRSSPHDFRPPKRPAPGPFSPRGLLERHVRAWRSPFVAAPAAGWLFYTITFVALLAVLPGLVPPEERAFVAAAMPLASIVSSMTLGVALLRRIGAVRVVLLGFVLSLAVAAALPFVPVGPLPCIALFAALGLVQGASFASIPELNPAPAEQALASGALAQAGNLGNACGTPLLLALLGAGGLGAMTAAVVACYAVAIAAHAGLAARRRASAGRKPVNV